MTLNRTWLVVAFAALLAACGSSSSSSGDGNNTPDTADAISSNSTTTGATSANDDDWYYFTTSGAGTIEIDLYGLTGDAGTRNVASSTGVPSKLVSSDLKITAFEAAGTQPVRLASPVE